LIELLINPDLTIAKERLYQDYIYECKFLLEKKPEMANKFAKKLIGNGTA
jgi:hypothetical protein